MAASCSCKERSYQYSPQGMLEELQASKPKVSWNKWGGQGQQRSDEHPLAFMQKAREHLQKHTSREDSEMTLWVRELAELA